MKKKSCSKYQTFMFIKTCNCKLQPNRQSCCWHLAGLATAIPLFYQITFVRVLYYLLFSAWSGLSAGSVLIVLCISVNLQPQNQCAVRLSRNVISESVKSLQCENFFVFRVLNQQTVGLTRIRLPFLSRYTPFTQLSKHRAIIEQTSSKCIQNTRARRVL